MLKKLIFTIIFLLLLPNISIGSEQGINVTADSAILINAKNGQVLYEKDPFQHRHPASTTKIATTMTAIQIGDLDKIVTVSEKAANTGESSIYLSLGEEISLNQLITGALVKSGNDACVAIAESLAGNEKMYMELVNNRVKLLGAQNTFFYNSNGLPAQEHYSCAYDLALISRYAVLNEKFAELVSTRYVKLNRENNWQQELKNTNKLLWRYPGATGIKTGTTNKAGNCLVASAKKEGKHLISVVLHSDNRYEDSTKLLDYGFNNYKPEVVVERGEIIEKVQVAKSDVKDLPVIVGKSIQVLTSGNNEEKLEKQVTIKDNIEAPVQTGDKLGEIRVNYRGKTVECEDLEAGDSVSSQLPFSKILKKQ